MSSFSFNRGKSTQQQTTGQRLKRSPCRCRQTIPMAIAQLHLSASWKTDPF
ncbi:MAG: hypothetical protein AAFY26_14135 [Cyanobacteria bacterium J06638_22]